MVFSNINALPYESPAYREQKLYNDVEEYSQANIMIV